MPGGRSHAPKAQRQLLEQGAQSAASSPRVGGQLVVLAGVFMCSRSTYHGLDRD